MKLDKIRFARLIAFVTHVTGGSLDTSDIEYMDTLITFDTEQTKVYPFNDDINELMRVMASGTNKIEAIKVHRKLTGWGLKESKDQVEKYWVSKLEQAPAEPFTPPRAYGAFGI